LNILHDTPLKATVSICTYNGAARIGNVLESLVPQTLPPDQWEVLVVDNACTDNTVDVCKEWRDKLPVSLRIVREKWPGLSYARGCAGRNAWGEIVCFLDDDNLPAPEFVDRAVTAFQNHPRAGAIGGKVLPIWQSPPNPLAEAVQDFALAICDRGDEAFVYNTNVGPVGAGICIRTQILHDIYNDPDFAQTVPGRTQKGYGGGEDLAIAILVWRLGWECWYEPSLIINHLLPEYRMEMSYLVPLYEGVGCGQAKVRRLYDWKARNPFLNRLIGLKDLLRYMHGCLWSVGLKRKKNDELSQQLHILSQHQLWGRAWQAIKP
jgi:glycosyltransferase involved in cell wall biosynthesis